jgi:hypothetical protein
LSFADADGPDEPPAVQAVSEAAARAAARSAIAGRRRLSDRLNEVDMQKE